MATIDEISIKISADPREALANLRKLQNEANATGRIFQNLRKFEIDADVGDAIRAIQRVKEELARLNNTEVKIRANTDAILKDLQALQRKINTDRSGAIQIRADVSRAQDALRDLQRQVQNTNDFEIDVRANVNAALDGIEDIGRLIDRNNIRDINIEVRADTRGAINALENLRREAARTQGALGLAAGGTAVLEGAGIGNLNIDAGSTIAELAQLKTSLDASKASISAVNTSEIAIKTSSTLAEIARLRAELQQLDDFVGQIEIELEAESDPTQAQRLQLDLENIQEQAENAKKSISNYQNSLESLSRQNASLNGQLGKTASAMDRQGAAATRAARDNKKLADTYQEVAKDAGGIGGIIGGLGGKLGGAGNAFKGFGSAVGGAVATVSTFVKGLGPIGIVLTALGLDRAIEGIVQFTTESVVLNAETERLNSILLSAAKSSTDYGTAIILASENQKSFGGSIQQNLSAIQQALFITNRYGVALKDLNTTAQLLALSNPFEGIEGAQFSLSELLAGDTTSIVERFNLPRKAVNELKASNLSAAETLIAVNKLLAEQGITLETLDAATSGSARAINELTAAWEEYKISVGETTEGPAIEFLNFLAGILDDLSNASYESAAAFVVAGASYEDYVKAASGLSVASQGQFSLIKVLTPAQYEYAQALIATGASTRDATEQALRLTDAQIEQANAADQAAAANTAATAEELAALQAILAAQQRSAEGNERLTAEAERLAKLRADGKLSEAELMIALEQYQADERAKIVRLLNGEILDEEEKLKQDLNQAASQWGPYREFLIQQIAEKWGLAENAVRDYVLAEAQLNLTRPTPFLSTAPNFLFQGGPLAPPLSLTDPFDLGGGGGGGARSSAKSDAERAAEELERIRQRILEEERRFAIERLRIEQDYYRKSAAARKVFSDTQFADRAGFYDQLGQIEDQGLRRSLSAQYEDAQIEAAKLRDTLGADVADQFLQTAAANILAQGQRQVEITTAQTEGRTGDAEYLQGVDRLYRDAEARKLERIKEGEGSIEQERATAVDELSINYAESLREFISGEDAKAKAVEFVNEALRRQASLLSPAANEELKLNVSITNPQLDELRRSIDALAVRLPAGV